MERKFRKAEKLRSHKRVEQLFDKGYSLQVKKLRVYWLRTYDNDPFPVKVILTVSKKKFRRAIHRNLVRRRMREAYRILKPALYTFMQRRSITIDLAIIYTGDPIPTYADIRDNMEQIINRIRMYYEESD